MLNHYFMTPFADAGDKAAIPNAVQPDGSVSMAQGFGPDYELPYANPDSKDVPRDKSNQLQWLISKALQEYQNNGVPDWVTAAQNGGVNLSYPIAARVRGTDGNVYHAMVSASNTDPTGDLSRWAPVGKGITAVTGLTNANVTLNIEQAARPVITLAGGLTGNIQIILPNCRANWLIVNNTTGLFSVTVKYATGAGVVCAQTYSTPVWGDGSNIFSATPPYILAAPGRVLNIRYFGASTTYTPTAGTGAIKAEVVGGGGGGGGTTGTGVSEIAAGAGGGGAGYSQRYITSAFAGVAIGIGPGGGSAPGSGGAAGGTTSFGALMSASGGGGGTIGAAAPVGGATVNGGAGGGVGAGGNINIAGGLGMYAFYAAVPVGGAGGASKFGAGATGGSGTGGGGTATVFGAGGGGGSVQASFPGGASGGSGSSGVVIIEEYSAA